MFPRQTNSRGNDEQLFKGHKWKCGVQAEGAAGAGVGQAETGSSVLARRLALGPLHLHQLQGRLTHILDPRIFEGNTHSSPVSAEGLCGYRSSVSPGPIRHCSGL